MSSATAMNGECASYSFLFPANPSAAGQFRVATTSYSRNTATVHDNLFGSRANQYCTAPQSSFFLPDRPRLE